VIKRQKRKCYFYRGGKDASVNTLKNKPNTIRLISIHCDISISKAAKVYDESMKDINFTWLKKVLFAVKIKALS